MTKEFGLTRVSAHGSVATVQQRLRRKVRALLDVKETEIDSLMDVTLPDQP